MSRSPSASKIQSIETILRQLSPQRAAGRKVVHCHGCFDIVHPGHIRYLEEARKLGDVLVVSLTGDAAISKGPGRPYIPQELRAENLAALQFVDWVVIDPHPTACELIEQLKPDVYIKGREYATSSDPRFLREKQLVEQHGGRVVFHTGDVVFSSTRLLQTLRRDDLLEHRRLRSYCERHEIHASAAYSVLDTIADLPVLVVGDAIRERYVNCIAAGVATDSPLTQYQTAGSQEFWGGAAAVALHLAALGARPTLLTGAGREPGQRDAFAELSARGVGVEILPARPDVITRTTYLADDLKTFNVIDGSTAPLDSTQEREAAAWIQKRLSSVRLLILSDDGFGMASPGLVHASTLAARSLRVCVAAQTPGIRGDLRNFQRADLLVATERQLREAMHDYASSLPAVAWNLLNANSADALLVSLRKTGWMSFLPRGRSHDRAQAADRLQSDFLSTMAGPIVDALGVDHAALAISAAARAVGASLPLCHYFACCAEALAASGRGDALVTRDDLLQWLARRPELHPAGRFIEQDEGLWTPPPRVTALAETTP